MWRGLLILTIYKFLAINFIKVMKKVYKYLTLIDVFFSGKCREETGCYVNLNCGREYGQTESECRRASAAEWSTAGVMQVVCLA